MAGPVVFEPTPMRVMIIPTGTIFVGAFVDLHHEGLELCFLHRSDPPVQASYFRYTDITRSFMISKTLAKPNFPSAEDALKLIHFPHIK